MKKVWMKWRDKYFLGGGGRLTPSEKLKKKNWGENYKPPKNLKKIKIMGEEPHPPNKIEGKKRGR